MVPKESDVVEEEKKPDDLAIFISHPHDTKEIANVLRQTIDDWSNGVITIHQTSDDSTNPITVGDVIKPQLVEYLQKSCCILLVYVNAESAAYCMWEAGVGVARGSGPLTNTRIVVFQCKNEIPSVFKDELLIKMTENGIKKFTNDFHKSPTFFPTFGRAFAPTAKDDLIERKSHQLYAALQQAMASIQSGEVIPPEIFPRWISFTVTLEEIYVNEIEQIANEIEESKDGGSSGLDKALIKARSLIEQHCTVDRYPRHLPRVFDMSEFPKGRTKLKMLHNRWKNYMIREKKEVFIKLNWWREICDQMTLAIAVYSAREIQIPLKSAADEGTWYLPAVTQKTELTQDKKIEFDISLIRIPQDGKIVKIHLE